MGTYFAVFSNFGARTQIGAHFDVAADTLAAPQGTPILFEVYDVKGQSLAQFETHTNNNCFASNATLTGPNQNFFRITNNQPGAVRVRTPDTAVQTGVLEQRGADTRLLLGVPPLATSDRRPVALGKIFPLRWVTPRPLICLLRTPRAQISQSTSTSEQAALPAAASTRTR